MSKQSRKRSRRQIRASRANGARSQGPVTPAGHARAAYAPVTHGLTANTVLLAGESRERFEALLAAFVDHFHPVNAAEYYCIEEMAWAKWRQRRAVSFESLLLDKEIASQRQSHIPAARAATAWSAGFRHVRRHETAHENSYRRALRELLRLQETRDEYTQISGSRINNLPATRRPRFQPRRPHTPGSLRAKNAAKFQRVPRNPPFAIKRN